MRVFLLRAVRNQMQRITWSSAAALALVLATGCSRQAPQPTAVAPENASESAAGDSASSSQPDHVAQGLALLQSGETDKAIADFDMAIKLQPRLPVAFLSRGLAKEDKSDFGHAIEDFTQAIKLDPKYVAAYDERASAYERIGAHDKALADAGPGDEARSRKCGRASG